VFEVFTVKVYDSHFVRNYTYFHLTTLQWLKLKLTGRLLVFFAKKKGWTGKLPFYIVHCEKHGYFIDYPHGFKGWNEGFNCPSCLKELLQEVKKK